MGAKPKVLHLYFLFGIFFLQQYDLIGKPLLCKPQLRKVCYLMHRGGQKAESSPVRINKAKCARRSVMIPNFCFASLYWMLCLKLLTLCLYQLHLLLLPLPKSAKCLLNVCFKWKLWQWRSYRECNNIDTLHHCLKLTIHTLTKFRFFLSFLLFFQKHKSKPLKSQN